MWLNKLCILSLYCLIDGYIETAIKIAGDTDYLQSTRQDLRERVQRSPLCDCRSFANEVATEHVGPAHKILIGEL